MFFLVGLVHLADHEISSFGLGLFFLLQLRKRQSNDLEQHQWLRFISPDQQRKRQKANLSPSSRASKLPCAQTLSLAKSATFFVVLCPSFSSLSELLKDFVSSLLFYRILPIQSICQKIWLGHFSTNTMGSPKWHIIEFKNQLFGRKQPKQPPKIAKIASYRNFDKPLKYFPHRI